MAEISLHSSIVHPCVSYLAQYSIWKQALWNPSIVSPLILSQPTPVIRCSFYDIVPTPWAHTAICKQGLSVVLSGGAFEEKSDEEKAELLLQSEVFYFNRYVQLILDPSPLPLTVDPIVESLDCPSI